MALSHVSVPSHRPTWDGGTVLGTPIVSPYMALSHVSVPSHRPTWDGWDCPRDSHACVPPYMALSHVSVPSHRPTWDGGTVLGTPMCPTLHGSVPRVRPTVPHGTGGTVLGTPMCPVIHGLSHVSVPSHCPTWDWRDCPRDSHVSRHTWLVPCVHCPTWDWRDCPRDSHVSRHTWLVPCVRPVPLGLEGLS